MVHIDPNLIYALLAIVAGGCILLSHFGPTPNTNGDGTLGSAQATIKKATFRKDGWLELVVEAGHDKIVEEDLDLPDGTLISDIVRNRSYRVEIQVDAAGAVSDKELFDRAVELAEEIGYSGKVKKA